MREGKSCYTESVAPDIIDNVPGVCVYGRCGPPPWVTKGHRRACYCPHVSVARRVSLSAPAHDVRLCTRVRP